MWCTYTNFEHNVPMSIAGIRKDWEPSDLGTKLRIRWWWYLASSPDPPSLSMLHATLTSWEGLGTRLGDANVMHMKMGGAGHETWPYFKFTDELRAWGGTISVQGGLPIAVMDGPGGQGGGTDYSGTNGPGGPFIPDTDGRWSGGTGPLVFFWFQLEAPIGARSRGG